MPRFRNDTGSVLNSLEFGVIPPGEFEAVGYDPEVHGVIPGCTWLDAPKAKRKTAAEETEPPGDPADDTKPAGKRKSAQDKEAGE